MRVLTIDTAAADFTAYDHAIALAADLAQLPEGTVPTNLGDIDKVLGALSDKKLILLRNAIQKAVDGEEWAVVSPGAYDGIRGIRSKAATADKRTALSRWFDAEHVALDALITQAAAAAMARTPAPVSPPPAAPIPAPAPVQPITASQGVDVVVEIQPKGKTKGERAPADELSAMSVPELQAVARVLFDGLETRISAKSELLRRIRRGRRQQAEGQPVRWAVPSPGAKAPRPAKAKLVRVAATDVALVLKALRTGSVVFDERIAAFTDATSGEADAPTNDAVSRLEDALLVKATSAEAAE